MPTPFPPSGELIRIPAGIVLVSKTDLNGTITYANDAFAEVSGYGVEELVGSPHAIDRHPHLPAWVFDGMWRRLKKGKPWRGVLMNRRKNGDYYWVDAFIIPIKKHGQIIEYMSVRLDATPEQITSAQAQFSAVRPPNRHRFTPRRFLSIKHGVLAGVLFVVLVMLVIFWFGQRNLDDSAESFYELHAYREILATVAETDRYAGIAQNQLLMALRHAPKNSRVTAEDAIEVPEHLEQVRKAQQAMSKSLEKLARHEVVERYLSGTTGAGESAAITTQAASLIKAYLAAVRHYYDEGLSPAALLIEQGNFDEGEEKVVGPVGNLVAIQQDQSAKLGAYFADSADRHHHAMDELLHNDSKLIGWWLLFSIAVVVTSSIWFFQDTMNPLRRAIDAMRRISEGDLSERLDIYGYGEPGEVVSTLATMQIHLKVMLDEIRLASANVHAQIGKLNQTVIAMLNNIEDSHAQAAQIMTTLEYTGADTIRLAAISEGVFQRIQALLPQTGDTADMQALNDLAKEAAGLAGLNDFAATEVRRLAQNIMGYLIESREGVNTAWATGQDLEKTSKVLNELFESFSPDDF